MEILWHVSFDKVPEGRFMPRIPENRINQGEYIENDTIKRVCFSNSIENCINAMPCGGFAALGLNEMKKRDYSPIFYGYPLFLDGEREVLEPSEVKKYVYDAEFNKEYWLTSEIQIKPVVLEMQSLEYSMKETINGPVVPFITKLNYDVFKGEVKDFRSFFKCHKSFSKNSNREILNYVGQCLQISEVTENAIRK